MKNLLTVGLVLTGLVFFTSCGDDDNGGGGSNNSSINISGIPASASVKQGDTLNVPGVTLEAAQGFASFNAVISGATSATLDLSDLITEGETSATVDLAIPTASLNEGLNTVTFTLTDAAGGTEVVLHDLTITLFGFVSVTSDVTSDATWTSDNVYSLGGRIIVADGVTLTIEPGTIIKGEAGGGANATALIFARGSTMDVVGTATAPIIFTSVADEITPTDVAAGDFGSPNLEPTVNGLWGGVIVLGNAVISASAASVQIEGIPGDDANGLYGGTETAYDAGDMAYVMIRHGGTNIGSGDEINGLTLGGLNKETSVDFVEIVANQDDGLEIFGGDIVVNNVLAWNCADDGLDTDQGYFGTIDNFLVVNTGGSVFELDGPEGDDPTWYGETPVKFHTLSNGSVYVGVAGRTIDVDGDTNVKLEGVYFTGYSNSTTGGVSDAASSQTAKIPTPNDDGITFAEDLFEVTDIEVTVPTEFVDADGDPVTGVTVEVDDLFPTTGGYYVDVTGVDKDEQTVGADITKFSWTWASQSGALGTIGFE